MSYIDDLNQAATEALAASSSATDSAQIMFDVANGGETTTVTTANGEVKTLAKAIKDIIDSIEAGVEAPQVEPQTLSAGQTTVSLTTMTTEGIAVYVEGSREFDFTVVNSTDFEFGESFPDGTRIWIVKRDIEGTADSFTVNTSTGTQTLVNALEDRGSVFDSVADLGAATNLQIGQKVRTLGYYSPGDGGGNDYEIVAAGTGTDDGGSFIDLSGSGLQAKGLFGDKVSVKKFGARGNNANDDKAAIQSAADYKSDGLKSSLYFPEGDYLVNGVIEVLSLDASGSDFYLSIQGDAANIHQQDSDSDTFYIHRGNGDNELSGWVIHKISGVNVFYTGIDRNNTGAAFRAKRSLSSIYSDIVIEGAPFGFVEEGCGQTRFDRIFVGNNSMTIGEYGQAAWFFTNNASVGRCFGSFMSNCEQQGPAGQGYKNSIRIDSLDGLYISNCHLNNAEKMVLINPDGEGLRDVVKQVFFNNVYFDGNTWANNKPLRKVSIEAITGGLHPGTIDIEGLYFSNCFFRVGDYGIVTEKSASNDGFRNVTEIEVSNCEFRQFDVNYFDVSMPSALDALSVVEHISLNGNTIHDGPAGGAGASGNPVGVAIAGRSFIFTGNSITGDWNNSGSAPVFIKPDSENVIVKDNAFNTERNIQVSNASNGSNIYIGSNAGYRTEGYGEFTGTTDANGLVSIPHGLVDIPVYASVTLRGDNVREAVLQTVGELNIIARIRNTTDNSDMTGITVTLQWFAVL